MAGEGLELSPRSGTSDDGVPSSTKLVDLLHFYYAWVLFAVFLVAFVVNTILTAEPSAEARGPIRLGPGGKPLPPTSARKNKEALEKKKRITSFTTVMMRSMTGLMMNCEVQSAAVKIL